MDYDYQNSEITLAQWTEILMPTKGQENYLDKGNLNKLIKARQ